MTACKDQESKLAVFCCLLAPQQRRLLRIQGMAKSIIDKILELNCDDTPSNLAAATLLYILTDDVILISVPADAVCFFLKYINGIICVGIIRLELVSFLIVKIIVICFFLFISGLEPPKKH